MSHNACTWWAQYRYVQNWFQAIKTKLCVLLYTLTAPSALIWTQYKLNRNLRTGNILSPRKAIGSSQHQLPCHTNIRASSERNTTATPPWPGSWSATQMYQKKFTATVPPHPKLLRKNRNSKLFPECTWKHEFISHRKREVQLINSQKICNNQEKMGAWGTCGQKAKLSIK